VPRRVDHDERRRTILEALCRIAAAEGAGAVSFRQVAAAAGVSVRLVQYYFGTKADLLHAANRYVAQRAGPRITSAVAALGPDPEPRAVVRALAEQFLARDDERRDAMVLFYAFFTAQLTDARLARSSAAEVPQALVMTIARQIERARERGDVDGSLDAGKEALMFVSALPGIVAGAMVGYHSDAAAEQLVDYAIDRLFTVPTQP
jgi:TetR/AcrR family transcriptional regulator, transcriptional repressor of bet genes